MHITRDCFGRFHCLLMADGRTDLVILLGVVMKQYTRVNKPKLTLLSYKIDQMISKKVCFLAFGVDLHSYLLIGTGHEEGVFSGASVDLSATRLQDNFRLGDPIIPELPIAAKD